MFKQVQLPRCVDKVCHKLQPRVSDINKQVEQVYPVLIGL